MGEALKSPPRITKSAVDFLIYTKDVNKG